MERLLKETHEFSPVDELTRAQPLLHSVLTPKSIHVLCVTVHSLFPALVRHSQLRRGLPNQLRRRKKSCFNQCDEAIA